MILHWCLLWKILGKSILRPRFSGNWSEELSQIESFERSLEAMLSVPVHKCGV